MEEGHGAEHRFQSNALSSPGQRPPPPHSAFTESPGKPSRRSGFLSMSCPSQLGPTINLSRLVWPPTTSPGVGQRPCVWLRSGVRAERAGGPPRAERPRADTRVLREEGGRPGSLRRTQSWGHSRGCGVKGATERHDGVPRGLVMPLQKGGAAGSRQRGGRAGALGHKLQLSRPGHRPQTRRVPRAPTGWASSPGPPLTTRAGGPAPSTRSTRGGRRGRSPAEELGLPAASEP